MGNAVMKRHFGDEYSSRCELLKGCPQEYVNRIKYYKCKKALEENRRYPDSIPRDGEIAVFNIQGCFESTSDDFLNPADLYKQTRFIGKVVGVYQHITCVIDIYNKNKHYTIANGDFAVGIVNHFPISVVPKNAPDCEILDIRGKEKRMAFRKRFLEHLALEESIDYEKLSGLQGI